jgi:hypothetical protein
MLRMKNIRAAEVDLARQGVFNTAGSGAPTGTTGAGKCGPGSTYADTATGKVYTNTGTKAAPTWTIVGTQT